MAISKFAVACVAAILAGGISAGLADDGATGARVQVADETPVTPISALARPAETLDGVPVRFVSGKAFGRVVAVATDAAGRATRVQVTVDGNPGTTLWLAEADLDYSRAQDSIVANDVHAPSAMTVASR